MNAKIKKMQELVADLSRDEIIWLNGYLAGLVEGSKEGTKELAVSPAATPVTPTINKITLH